MTHVEVSPGDQLHFMLVRGRADANWRHDVAISRCETELDWRSVQVTDCPRRLQEVE